MPEALAQALHLRNLIKSYEESRERVICRKTAPKALNSHNQKKRYKKTIRQARGGVNFEMLNISNSSAPKIKNV